MQVLLTLLVALLLANTASATRTDLACSGMTPVVCWEADYDDEVGTTPGIPIAYRNFGTNNPTFAAVLDYNNLPKALREQVWNKIIEAEITNGGTGLDDFARPVDADGSSAVFYMTQAEAHESYGAKIAHALWLETNSLLPWSISGLDQEGFEGLFKPEQLYYVTTWTNSTWDPTADPAVLAAHIIDNSPRSTYDFTVTNALGGLPYTGTQRDAVETILSKLGGKYVHVRPGDPTFAVTVAESWVDKISRDGCHSAGHLMESWARSINIPVNNLHGYLDGTGFPGHSGDSFPTVDGYIYHGDLMYLIADTSFSTGDYIPVHYALDSWAWASGSLSAYDPNNSLKNARRSIFFYWLWRMQNGAYDDTFCTQGWSVVQNTFAIDSPQDDHWADMFEAELIARTGCSGTP